MPTPTMPTGTVSGGSNASRTFPARDERRTNDDRSVRPAPAESNARADGRGGAPSSLREEVTRLRRENEELRRTLRETRDHRQDVIDRYERLIDGDAAASPDASSQSAGASSSPDGPVRAAPSPRASPARTKSLTQQIADELDARWTRLRRRYKQWERESGL